MAYSPFNNSEIAAGEPNKQELWQKLKANFTDHELRILSLEGGSAVPFMPIRWGIQGLVAVRTLEVIYRTSFSISAQNVRILSHLAGSSGSHEVEVEKFDAGLTNVTSILSTRPTLAFGAGNYAISNNAIIDVNEQIILAGQFIRARFTARQGGLPRGASIFLEFEKV